MSDRPEFWVSISLLKGRHSYVVYRDTHEGVFDCSHKHRTERGAARCLVRWRRTWSPLNFTNPQGARKRAAEAIGRALEGSG